MVMVMSQGKVLVTATEEPKKLWGGRFTGETDPLMEKFNESLPMDRRMYAEDIKVIHFLLVFTKYNNYLHSMVHNVDAFLS
jgi:hypothetical protein